MHPSMSRRVDDVKSNTGIPCGTRNLSNVEMCCFARRSVGAIRAADAPLLKVRAASIAATAVFPDPTSP